MNLENQAKQLLSRTSRLGFSQETQAGSFNKKQELPINSVVLGKGNLLVKFGVGGAKDGHD